MKTFRRAGWLLAAATTAATAVCCLNMTQKVDNEGFCRERPNDLACKNGVAAPPTASCDAGTQPDAATGVFVAPGGSDTNGDGSRERPYATLATAVSVGKPNVYVAPGTYSLNTTLELAKPVNLDGGWTPSWQRACDNAGQTVLQASGASVSPVVRTSAGAALAYLTVATVNQAPAASADQAGATLVGVHVSSGDATLTRVRVQVGQAGDAGNASSPSSTDPGAVACNGVTDCLCEAVNQNPFDAALYDACVQQSLKPQAGASAAAATAGAGTFTADGYQPGDGQTGEEGRAGQNGVNGSPYPPPDSSTGERKNFAPLRCLCAGTDGSCGAQEFCKKQADTSSCTTAKLPNASEPTLANGKCGCGGKAGRGGKGGRGGGASVGVLATGGRVQLRQGGQVQTGGGGQGRAGTEGGIGGQPSAGKTGQQCTAPRPDMASPSSVSSCQWSGGICFATTTTTTTKDGGIAGGTGAPGGAGGKGGPGSGGPSFGIVTVGGASVQLDADTKVTPGQGGLGGDGQTLAESAAQKAY